MSQEARMQRVPTSNGHVAVEMHGQGPPIVLLHSGGHDRGDFDAVVPALSRTHRTVAIDLPGHGDSAMFAPPSSTRASLICNGIVDAIDALSLPPAVLVGNSVGGMAALALASRRPGSVRALVLVSPSGFVEQTSIVRAFCWLQGKEWVRRTTGMAFARHYLKSRNEHVTRLLARMERRRSSADFIEMEAALWRSFGAPDSDLSAHAAALRCPTLLVWGTRDPVLRAAVEGTRARALLPSASWAEMDCGHVPFVEDPAGFISVIAPFLRDLTASEPVSAP